MESSETRLPRSQAAVLVLACVLTYANAIGGGFTYDDKAIVRDNPRIHTPANFSKIFTTSYFGGPRGSGTAYRPVLLVSYAVQWWIHGRQAAAFHAVNVLLHAGATLLLAALLFRVGIAPAAAFASALVFAVHPLHVEAVTSLVGRGEVLASVFALLYLRLALHVFERGPYRVAAFAAALACYALSMLTKESGSSAPAIAFLLFVYASEGSLKDRLRRAFGRGLPILGGSAIALLGVLLLRRWALGGFLKTPGIGVFEVENALAHVGAWPRAVNACVIFFRYLGRFVVPLHLSADESAWSIKVVAPGSPAAVAALVLLAALTIAALWRLSSRSPLALGFLFFCLALLPASNLLFFTGTIFAERIAYLPSAGLCLAAGALLAGTAPRLSALAPSRRKLLAAVALLLAARTVVRNAVWWSDEALFLNLVRAAPASAKAHYDIAYIWAAEKQYARARGEYARATEIYDAYWDAWAGKGNMEKNLGLYDEAEESYGKAIEANPDYENGYFGLGLVREARGDLAGAEEIYEEGLDRKKDSLPLAYRLALARSERRWPEAVPDWKRALALGPETASVHAGYAKWLAREGKWEDAAGEARQTLRLAPGDQDSLRLLARQNALAGRRFAEALAREKIYRLSGSPEDWQTLLAAARGSEAYGRRLSALKGSGSLAAPGGAKAGSSRK
jgi:tetratricopeptide (TPR) repeat protein